MTFRDILLILVCVILFGVAFVLLTPALSDIRNLQEELQTLQMKYEAQQQEVAQLQKEIDDLRSGKPQAVERVAREKFGYCRPGEEVFHFE
ncbi:MAG TPA: septum formation initiator family protein [Lentisphaeria bacterium]|nr:septum formation initiator family protein [Lentisphaeria bacterium]